MTPSNKKEGDYVMRDLYRRDGRSSPSLEDKGVSNWPWIMGAKLGFVLNDKEN
jgi:hypothetical protein